MDLAGNAKEEFIARELLCWFTENRRSFPWRKIFDHPDPYIILFTEIMLQRTRADQIIPVYDEFVEKFPTFKKIEGSSPRQVVKLFSKLGLYSRARRIPKLIRAINTQHHGVIPHDLEALRGLPGVGDYVAKAVMCYAFGENVAAVDTNVVRIISRIFGLPDDPDRGRRNRKIAALATSLIPSGKSKQFNQCLLDFGAAVCKRVPLCGACPLARCCDYYSARKTNPDGSLRLFKIN
jgi:A/G-specific adenine glycosylase